MRTALSTVSKIQKNLKCSNHREAIMTMPVSRSDPVQEPHHGKAMSNSDSGKKN